MEYCLLPKFHFPETVSILILFFSIYLKQKNTSLPHKAATIATTSEYVTSTSVPQLYTCSLAAAVSSAAATMLATSAAWVRLTIWFPSPGNGTGRSRTMRSKNL
jgi:hypothetical protein